jgi:undecaprenyl-phosphate galactose phosphotransferase
MSKMPYKIIKRVSDIVLSLFLLILFLPFLLLVSFLIWLGDRNEIFVRDPLRIGLNGKEFRMYKFRTMIPNAHKEILENPVYSSLKKKWESNGNKLRIEEDIRITRVGKLLRKTDLDELPQLLNVLIGDMSLVGPRPMYKDELERHLKSNPEDEEYLKYILSVRPGITGLWQVSGRNEIPFTKRLKMDAWYSDKQSLLLDMQILLKTPYVVLTRKGAYE